MKINPFFSIITICLNSKNFLELTISSVINQEFSDYEYIIIDGGSTDKTLDIIKKYEPRIDKWKSEKDSGIYDAMNKGITLSKGKYLLFLNSGDTFYDKKVLKSISVELHDKKNIGIFYGKAELINQPLNISKYFGAKIDLNSFWKGMPICHQSIFFNRKLFELFGLYDVSYKILADYEFIYRYFNNKIHCNFKDIFVDLVISKYLLGGFSLQNNLVALKEAELINRKYKNFNIKKRIYYKCLKINFIIKKILRKYYPRLFNLFSSIRFKLAKKTKRVFI